MPHPATKQAIAALYARLSPEERCAFRNHILYTIFDTLEHHRPNTYTASDSEWALQSTYKRMMQRVRRDKQS